MATSLYIRSVESFTKKNIYLFFKREERRSPWACVRFFFILIYFQPRRCMDNERSTRYLRAKQTDETIIIIKQTTK